MTTEGRVLAPPEIPRFPSGGPLGWFDQGAARAGSALFGSGPIELVPLPAAEEGPPPASLLRDTPPRPLLLFDRRGRLRVIALPFRGRAFDLRA